MIDVKQIGKPKGGASGGGLSNGGGGYSDTAVKEAQHAAKADLATFADQADYAKRAGHSSRAAYADMAGDLAEGSPVLTKFLSRVVADVAEGHITFNQGLTSIAQAIFKTGISFGRDGGKRIDGEGNAFLESVRSTNFSSSAQSGFGIERRDDGQYQMGIAALEVWGKAIFHELEIRKVSSVGGDIVLSPASGRVFKVDEVREDDGSLTGWRCWLLRDDGTTATLNSWRKYDQARCQTFDVRPGVYEDVSNKFYWRLVTAVSEADEAITDEGGNVLYDGQRFGWVELSAADCATGSDAPSAGDVIVLDGNRTEAERQNVLMLETNGADAPRIAGFTNVHGYTHEGRTVFSISPNGVRFVSDYFQWTSQDGTLRPQQNYRGEWEEGADPPYKYYDTVDHDGTLWLCIVAEGQTATDEPSAQSEQWRNLTPVVDYAMDVSLDGQSTVEWGETVTATCTVWHGTEQVDTSRGWAWAVERDSGDAAEDTAWNQSAKATAFDGTIALGFNASENDLGLPETSPYGTRFTFTATETATRRKVTGVMSV